jgi:hypothetical protein
MKGAGVMQHVRFDCVDGRLITANEGTSLKLHELRFAASLEEWRRILFRAADIIDHLGWCRGMMRHGTDYCAVGAIIAAFNKGEIPEEECLDSFLLAKPAVQWIIFKVESYLIEPYLMSWNDRRARSAGQVASLLRAVASQA